MAPWLRLLILLAGVWLVIHLVRRLLVQRRRRPSGETIRDSVPRMLRCEHCGVYVPQSEAITFEGKTYCSESHRREARS